MDVRILQVRDLRGDLRGPPALRAVGPETAAEQQLLLRGPAVPLHRSLSSDPAGADNIREIHSLKFEQSFTKLLASKEIFSIKSNNLTSLPL